MSTTNPIVEQMNLLRDQWAAFAKQKQARLLVWQARPEELALLEAFFAKESDSELSDTPDLHLELESAFSNERAHGYLLANELIAAYDEVASADPQLAPAWQLAKASGQNELDSLLRVLASFRSLLVGPHTASKLVVWLAPEQVSAWEPYLLWLHRLVLRCPPEIRFVVTEPLASPHYAALAKVDPARVVVTPCGLSLFAAMEQVVMNAGQQTPGDRFRLLQLRVIKNTASGDLEQALRWATAATETANAQGWPQLAAGIELIMGNTHEAHAQPLEAVRCYAEAARLGAQQRCREADHPDLPACGARIVLQARLGQAAVLLSIRALGKAAEAYEQAATLAVEVPDARSELDACRLASFCRAELGEVSVAWELGLRGLRIGAGMDEQTRVTSTLPYLADQLLRFTERSGPYRVHRDSLEQQLTRLLGKDWRSKIPKAS